MEEYNMLTFKEFIKESSYPFWVKSLSVSVQLKINSLSKQIENEEDIQKQNKLIAQQNKLNGYLNILKLGLETRDKKILSRVKSLKL